MVLNMVSKAVLKLITMAQAFFFEKIIQENTKKADSQNLQIFKSEKSKNMESAKSLLQEISKILKMLEAKFA